MSGGLSLAFKTITAIYATPTVAAAVSSSTLQVQGNYLILSTGYIYYFDPNINNLGTNDIFISDGGGCLRYNSNPNINITNLNTINSNLGNLSDITVIGSGTYSGTVSTETATINITVTGATSSSFAFCAINTADNLCEITWSCGTNVLNVTFLDQADDYTLNYLVFSI